VLQFRTVSNEILELLTSLQTIQELKTLRLVGGTALALQMGHRRSVDIDLFGKIEIDNYKLTELLKPIGNIKILKNSGSINIYKINNIKVDIVNYPYDWIKGPIIENELTLAGIEDISAMKLAAITGRGTKKDFIDLDFLLKKYTIKDIFNFYDSKFPDGNKMLVLKSLLYFDDADEDEMPEMFTPIDWNTVKAKIKSEVDKYIKSLK